jgi:hypothetical protein
MATGYSGNTHSSIVVVSSAGDWARSLTVRIPNRSGMEELLFEFRRLGSRIDRGMKQYCLFTSFKEEGGLIVNPPITPLLFHTISKLHSPFTPYGTPFILCKLLPNLGIQTTRMCSAQLIRLPII